MKNSAKTKQKFFGSFQNQPPMYEEVPFYVTPEKKTQFSG